MGVINHRKWGGLWLFYPHYDEEVLKVLSIEYVTIGDANVKMCLFNQSLLIVSESKKKIGEGPPAKRRCVPSASRLFGNWIELTGIGHAWHILMTGWDLDQKLHIQSVKTWDTSRLPLRQTSIGSIGCIGCMDMGWGFLSYKLLRRRMTLQIDRPVWIRLAKFTERQLSIQRIEPKVGLYMVVPCSKTLETHGLDIARRHKTTWTGSWWF